LASFALVRRVHRLSQIGASLHVQPKFRTVVEDTSEDEGGRGTVLRWLQSSFNRTARVGKGALFCAPCRRGWPWWARFAVPSLRLRFHTTCIRSNRAERPSLPRLVEISQIWRLLAFASRHQIAIGAQKIILFTNGDVVVGFIAIIFVPNRIFLPSIVFHHRPRPRQRVVDRGDLVMQ